MHTTSSSSGSSSENSKKTQRRNGRVEGEKKGLDFMGLQFTIFDKRRDLQKKRKITPAEYFLLEEIEAATIGARNKRAQICSKTEISIQELSNRMGYKERDKIWTLLKSLHFKKYILREPTELKGVEIIGLNPKIFGQILIDSHHEIEARKHLKLAVDNSQNRAENLEPQPTDRPLIADEPSVNHLQSVGEIPTNRRLNESQDIENIEEKTPLDSSRFILDGFRGQKSKETFSLSGEQEAERQRQKIIKQVTDIKSGKLVL